jgi:hypothetical protein
VFHHPPLGLVITNKLLRLFFLDFGSQLARPEIAAECQSGYLNRIKQVSNLSPLLI